MIFLEEINPSNWRIDLKVSKEQSGYVSDSMKILARAYAYRNMNSRAYIIRAGFEPVGMAMFYDCPELNAYDLSQFFIDEGFQHKGYGYEAVKELISIMKNEARFPKITLCYIEGNFAAYYLYKKCGFSLTGDRDGNEIVMELIF